VDCEDECAVDHLRFTLASAHLTSTNLAMTASEVPQWLQTVNEKRLARENAIHTFHDTHKTQSGVQLPLAQLQNKTVDGVLDSAP
jgi:outer membrane receptor for ferric coprogen and ferric-rhodotorulic acid